MAVSGPEKKMKKALKDAGHTIADYIDPAPGDDRDAEETLDEIIGEIDNDEVGRAIAQSDINEGKPQPSKDAIVKELKNDPQTRPFAPLVPDNEPEPAPAENAPPWNVVPLKYRD